MQLGSTHPDRRVEPIRESLFWRYTSAVGTRLHNYSEVREYLEKERPDWLQVLIVSYHRASRLLASESAGGLIRERCDA